jgi:hypothetical protein
VDKWDDQYSNLDLLHIYCNVLSIKLSLRNKLMMFLLVGNGILGEYSNYKKANILILEE